MKSKQFYINKFCIKEIIELNEKFLTDNED